MTKRSKVIIIIVVGLLAIASAVYLFVYQALDGLDTSTHKGSKIIFPHLKDTVYLMSSAWGLTGDHVEIVISKSPIAGRGSNKSSDFIFYEPTIYYKQEDDSLVIYSPSLANVPGNFNSHIKMKQVKIEDAEEIKRYEQDYGKLGLTRISVHDN